MQIQQNEDFTNRSNGMTNLAKTPGRGSQKASHLQTCKAESSENRPCVNSSRHKNNRNRFSVHFAFDRSAPVSNGIILSPKAKVEIRPSRSTPSVIEPFTLTFQTTIWQKSMPISTTFAREKTCNASCNGLQTNQPTSTHQPDEPSQSNRLTRTHNNECRATIRLRIPQSSSPRLRSLKYAWTPKAPDFKSNAIDRDAG